MKRQIRRSVFETNSSMVHSLVICSEEDFSKWKNGEMYYDRDNECLVPATEIKLYEFEDDDDRTCSFLSSEEYDDIFSEYYHFNEEFTTPNGDEMVVFGYYGHD